MTPATPTLPSYTADDSVFGFGSVEQLVFLDEHGQRTTLAAVARDVLRQVAPELSRDGVSKALNTMRPLNDMTGTPGARTLIDNLFDTGLTFVLPYVSSVVGASLVLLKIKASNINRVRHLGRSQKSGMENYAYDNSSVTESWTRSGAFHIGATVSGSGVGPAETRRLGTGRVALGYTNRSEVTQSITDTKTMVRTVMDWAGTDEFGFNFDVAVSASRHEMPRRPLANFVTSLLGKFHGPNRGSVTRDISGRMTWRIPSSMVDRAGVVPIVEPRPGPFLRRTSTT